MHSASVDFKDFSLQPYILYHFRFCHGHVCNQTYCGRGLSTHFSSYPSDQFRADPWAYLEYSVIFEYYMAWLEWYEVTNQWKIQIYSRNFWVWSEISQNLPSRPITQHKCALYLTYMMHVGSRFCISTNVYHQIVILSKHFVAWDPFKLENFIKLIYIV